MRLLSLSDDMMSNCPMCIHFCHHHHHSHHGHHHGDRRGEGHWWFTWMMTRPGRITSSMEPINDFICFLIIILIIFVIIILYDISFNIISIFVILFVIIILFLILITSLQPNWITLILLTATKLLTIEFQKIQNYGEWALFFNTLITKTSFGILSG